MTDYNIVPVPDVKVADDVLLQEQAGDAFLLHVESGQFFGLNRTGLVIWKALEREEDPIGALADRWPAVSLEERRRDVEVLLAALLEAGLVRQAP